MDVQKIAYSIGGWFSKNAPRILTGVGISSMFISVAFAIEATPKAEKKIEAKKRQKNVKKLSTIDVVKCTWKEYIWTALAFAAGTVCFIEANHKNEQRAAASAALATFFEEMHANYRRGVAEKIGEKKEAAIRAEVNQKRMDEDPPEEGRIFQQSNNGLHYLCEVPQDGKTLCYFPIRPGRYFYCKIEDVMHAASVLNDHMATRTEPYVSLDDFFYECGLPPFDVQSEGTKGRDLGWNLYSNGYSSSDYNWIKLDDPTYGQEDVMFKKNGAHGAVPCAYIDFKPGHYPKYDFMRS